MWSQLLAYVLVIALAAAAIGLVGLWCWLSITVATRRR
jgi:hypothetical protein